MDLTPASGFKGRPAASSSPSQLKEATRSPPPRSPSVSLSSLSSSPSSLFSTSSSVCLNSSAYQNNVKSLTQETEVARVSSTSASQATQSPSAPSASSPSALASDFFSKAPVQLSEDFEKEKREMYNPFHPTEGAKREEEECEKYDPFDPTGSPELDTDKGSGKFRGVKRIVKRGEDEEMKEEPPDSTNTSAGLPSPCLATKLPLRRTVDCSTSKAREQRDSGDSDHSEIEEGEIVGVGDKDGGIKRKAGEILPLNSPISFFGSKPERILRVLDGDGFVSVCTEGTWDVNIGCEEEPVVGVEDLRRKLVSRRKERYLTFPAASDLSPQLPPPTTHPAVSPTFSPLTPSLEQGSKNCKPPKSSKERDPQKSKERKAGEKERRKKKRKDKEAGQEKAKDKEWGQKPGKEVTIVRSSRSSSRKRKKRHHSSPEVTRSCSSSVRGGPTRRSSISEERQRERERDKDRDRDRDRARDRERDRGRDREREQSRTSSHRRDERDRDRDSNSHKKEKERGGRQHSSSTEWGISKRSKSSREKKVSERDRQRDRERRCDGRPVVPPSIQDLNGSDLFAIKRTITVTTTTTTTTVPGSPRLPPTSPCRPTQESEQPQKRKKKRKRHSAEEDEDQESCHSRSQSLSPPKYHSYELDHYSSKLEIDVLSLDGEALDSDYQLSLEDSPPAARPPEPPLPSPKTKTPPKPGRHHPKKKTRAIKKIGQSESSSSRGKGKRLSSLMITSGSASISSGLSSTKRARKIGKDKERDKGSRKEMTRSGKSKKEGGDCKKGKLQSKVSVLVREGVSSTTGSSVSSGKLGMDLLCPGGTGGGAGSSVVGGSIAVVFCRDNESRSPFLKPCSEPLSLGSRSKDLSSIGKRSSLASPPSSLTGPAVLKPKKAKPSSITSTSSSASSPSSSLGTKRRRRLGKKIREKGIATALVAGEISHTNSTSDDWGGPSLDAQSALGDGSKSVSQHISQAGPAPCSSSSSSSTSSSTSVLPPSSSPPHTPPPSVTALQDTKESSPDSQTVDSSCKTPDPSFLAEDCPIQTSPRLPASPSSLSTTVEAILSAPLPTTTVMPPPPDDAPQSLASPPCSSSSAGSALPSLSVPLSSSDPSSSSVSSSSAVKPLPPPPPPPAAPNLPWSLQSGVDCTTGGVLALTALLFKMEEANIASRAKAQEFIQATSQILSQANQSKSQQHAPPSSAPSSQIPPPPPSLPPPPGLSPTQFILHSSLPLVGCTKPPSSLLHPSIGGGCAQTPPLMMPMGLSGVSGGSGESSWDNESKDPDKYLKKLHTQERAVEEVKLAIKPYYQRKDINKEEYKDILRKAVHKICHSRTGEINPVKVSNLVKLYVQRYKYFRKHGRRMDEDEREEREEREHGALHSSA